MILTRTKTIDPTDLDMVLSEGLVNDAGDFYDYTFKMALEEELDGEELIACKYSIGLRSDGSKFMRWFYGWTATKVIHSLIGVGVSDVLLGSVKRDPPDEAKI